jgi:hypothetical protein
MRTLDVEELTAALAGPRPEREAVLESFRRKHRRRKARRRLCWAGGLTGCALVACAIAVTGVARPHDSVMVSPADCAPVSLAQSLAGARQAGASILVAYGSPAGPAATSGHPAASGYQAMMLHSVRTLSGPVIPSGTIAWTEGAPAAGDGQVLAIAWPAALVGSAVGPVVRTAPVIGGNVIVADPGCRGAASLAARPSPGQQWTLSGEAAPGGRYAIPLRVVEAAATSPAGADPADPPSTMPAPASIGTPGSGKASPVATAGNGNSTANGKAAAKTAKAVAKTAKSAAKAKAKATAKATKAKATSKPPKGGQGKAKAKPAGKAVKAKAPGKG